MRDAFNRGTSGSGPDGSVGLVDSCVLEQAAKRAVFPIIGPVRMGRRRAHGTFAPTLAINFFS